MKVCPLCGKEYPDSTTICTSDAEVLRSADDPLLGQTLADKYLIEKLIKRGGMGAVYLGKHVLMDKTVAIKVLRPSLAGDDSIVARFSREAKAASRISHPHAVSVTDFGEAESGVVFLVMEYLDGRTLKDIIRSEGPMPLNRAMEITRQVSGALDAAHQQGVVHRDLKSDNIMLSQTNNGDWAKVLDFGIAKIQQPEGVQDHDITAPNLVIGTPQYMSPEQCSQTGPIDARSDVYSLGIIIYEMLAGHVPFTGESSTVIMMKQLQDPPPSILDARPDLPVTVHNLIEQALAKDPAERFQTAGELSAALSQTADHMDPRWSAIVPPGSVTVPHTPVNVTPDDLDEVTVVRPRDEVTFVRLQDGPLQPVHQGAEPSPLAAVRPWRILVPAAIVLVAVFAVIFILTRGSGQTPSNQTNALPGQPGLVADPNSQPVTPAGTPTGDSERGIQATSASPPSSNANANTSGVLASPSPVTGDFGANANDNSGTGNKNANRRESPTPKATPSVDQSEPPPPPKASPTAKTLPKPTTIPTIQPPL